MADYEYRIVTQDGTVKDILTDATVEGDVLRWELNGWGTASFTIGVTDPQAVQAASFIDPLLYELQVWRDSTLLWWGPIVRGQADRSRLRVEAVGLEWYFKRRFVGPQRNNYLTNPSFESGLTGWSASGCSADPNTGIVYVGDKSAKLATASEGQDHFLRQQVSFPANPSSVGYILSGWCHIQADNWVGPALEERGLYVEASPNVDGYLRRWAPITNQTKRGQWVRLATDPIFAPKNQAFTLDVRLYCPGGAIRWDGLWLREPEAVSTGQSVEPAEDYSVLVKRLVEHAQSNHETKSDLNIATALDSVGVGTRQSYKHNQHANIWDAIRELTETGLFDVGVEWNGAGTTRTFHVYAPERGVDRSATTVLRLDDPITDISYVVDGTQSATSVRVLGSETGGRLEIGQATDKSPLNGLSLEHVESAPTETPWRTRQQMADGILQERWTQTRIPSVTIKDDALIGVLGVGDTVGFDLSHGWINDNTSRRIRAITLDPRTDQMTLELMP